MKRIIAACGNDCSACPRFALHPFEKTDDQLRRTAELWLKIGYRDRVVSNAEIACGGCRPENWCRYGIVKCCDDRGVGTCAECAEFPCADIEECFEVTKSFEPRCRQACSYEEFARIHDAFFEKEKNLKALLHK